MRREASSSRKNVAQGRPAKAPRRRGTFRCYVVPCYVFMGGAVLGACETGIKPTAMIAAPDSADQVLLSMSHNITDAGIQRAQVKADTAYLYSPSQTAELRNVTVTFYDVHGAPTSTLMSQSGFTRSLTALNSAAGLMPLAGWRGRAIPAMRAR